MAPFPLPSSSRSYRASRTGYSRAVCMAVFHLERWSRGRWRTRVRLYALGGAEYESEGAYMKGSRVPTKRRRWRVKPMVSRTRPSIPVSTTESGLASYLPTSVVSAPLHLSTIHTQPPAHSCRPSLWSPFAAPASLLPLGTDAAAAAVGGSLLSVARCFCPIHSRAPDRLLDALRKMAAQRFSVNRFPPHTFLCCFLSSFPFPEARNSTIVKKRPQCCGRRRHFGANGQVGE